MNMDRSLSDDAELQRLLREQQMFERGSRQPAAKVTRMHAHSHEHAHSSANREENTKPTSLERENQTTDAEATDMHIVGDVVERGERVTMEMNQHLALKPEARGFPVVKRRTESLFGRRQRANQTATTATATTAPTGLSLRGRIVERDVPAVKMPPSKNRDSSLGQQRGGGDAELQRERGDIDAENRAALAAMSEAEIRQAQQELLQTLDPALIAKWTKPKRKQATAARATVEERKGTSEVGSLRSVQEKAVRREAQKTSTAEQVAAFDRELASIQSEQELMERVQQLPQEERAKNEWMQPIPIQPSASVPASESAPHRRLKKKMEMSLDASVEPSNERFDFNGDDIATTQSVTTISDVATPVHSGLYHHGEDPSLPGYTMVELIHLARSTVAGQRAMALVTIAKILRKRQEVDSSLVRPRVLPRELPIAIRMALDDSNWTVMSAAVTALHAFVVPLAGETTNLALETEFGMILDLPTLHLHVNEGRKPDDLLQEVIYIDTSASEEDGSAISDEKLFALDPIQGLLKTTTVTRLAFMITTVEITDVEVVEKILDILTTIAEHSPKAAEAIAGETKLVAVLHTKFVQHEGLLTLDEEHVANNAPTVRLAYKALKLIRVVSQGGRAAAQALIGSGIVQSSKTLLGLRDRSAMDLLHLESLRIWRVLLGYGLDFHCFSYLFPLLCGLDTSPASNASAQQSAQKFRDWPDVSLAALFCALEAMAELGNVRDAEHYLSQLNHFCALAAQEIDCRISHNKTNDLALAAMLRFLSKSVGLITRVDLDPAPFVKAFCFIDKFLNQSPIENYLASGALNENVLLATLQLWDKLVHADIDGSEVLDEEQAVRECLRHTKNILTARISADNDSVTKCQYLLLAARFVIMTEYADESFSQNLFAAALRMVPQIGVGHQYWIHALLSNVLFEPSILQKVGVFANASDAAAMSHVLIPIYQALVNSNKSQDDHSRDIFGPQSTTPNDLTTYHLIMPQQEEVYVSSNLPLPSCWVYYPLSRLEYASSHQQADGETPTAPATLQGLSQAQSQEMALIISAVCRFIGQLEASNADIVAMPPQTETITAAVHDEDKLFHLLHVFFAGAEVLYEPHVDSAVSELLGPFISRIVVSPQPTELYDSFLRNLKLFETLEAPPSQDLSTSSEPTVSFGSDVETVLHFAERLVHEFVSTSFGHRQFAMAMTLFFCGDFPLEIRAWVWNELRQSNMLGRLAFVELDAGPTSDNRIAASVFTRCTSASVRIDEAMARSLVQALAPPPSQGSAKLISNSSPFAYWMAIRHLARYLFGSESSSSSSPRDLHLGLGLRLSLARQRLVQTLASNGSASLWHDLLTIDSDSTPYPPSIHPIDSITATQRRDRVFTQANLSGDVHQRLQQLLLQL